MKIKMFYFLSFLSKDTVGKTNRQATIWEKVFINLPSGSYKGLISRVYEKLLLNYQKG